MKHMKKNNAEAFVFLLLPLLVASANESAMPSRMKYESMFNFGNSLSDTGNYLAVGAPDYPFIGHLPYGESFNGGDPTGRASNGKLVVDFIAENFGLPFLTPYLKQAGINGSYPNNGMNFAVFGATALDVEYYYARNLGPLLITNDTLSIQVGWFKKWKNSVPNTKEGWKDYFEKSLFLVGNIGGNDYNLLLIFLSESIEQVRPIVPLVVEKIINATAALIKEGAVHLVVPGNLPIGCVSAFLTKYQGSNESDYNPKTGCLDSFNEFSRYHNDLLAQALEKLRNKYPETQITYADYYGASMGLYINPKLYGFSGSSIVACCGGGGLYNFNLSSPCGAPGSTVCEDPSTYVSWDGIHWTEAAYGYMAKRLLHGSFTSPPL